MSRSTSAPRSATSVTRPRVSGSAALQLRPGSRRRYSLGDYLVPVNADAPDVDVELIEVDDQVTGPLGVKGVGEIGQVGSSAAIANAVYHATGYRARELSIVVEHLLPHVPE
jgi:CO/xanthine dehydrogenase Mo-binding subunit